jgi:phage gpG-like protein
VNTEIRLVSDAITPDLQTKIMAVRNRQPILEAAGLQLLSWVQASFSDSSKRVLPWPARKSGSNPLLKKSGALVQSIRVVSVSNNSVVVGTDRKYAALHQFGTGPFVIRPKTKKALFWPGAKHPVKSVKHPGIPARPFFPVINGGWMQAAAERIQETITDALNEQLGI